MGLFENFPYTNFHRVNLEWMLSEMKSIVSEFGSLKDAFEELQNFVTNYLDNLDIDPKIREEVESEIADLISSGYFEEISKELYPTKALEIMRRGRLLDATNYTGAGPVLAGQSACYADNMYYSIGEVYGTGQIISVWSSTGTLLNQATFTNLGHGASIAAIEDKLYVADGYNNNVYIIDRSTLDYIDSVIIAPLDRTFAVSNNDGVLYIYGIDVQDNAYLRFCKYVEGIVEPLGRFKVSNGVVQGFTAKGIYGYPVFNKSNMIYKINMESGEIVQAYVIPDGDGLNPCGECEDLFKKDGKIYISTALYYPNRQVSRYQAAFVQEFFETDIDNILEKTDPLSYQRYQELVEITVNGAAAAEFNPSLTYTTIEEACHVLNYAGSGKINAVNISHGYALLHDGVYSLRGLSGSRTIDVLETSNANILWHQVSLKALYNSQSKIVLSAIDIAETVTNYQSELIGRYLSLATITSFVNSRSSVKIHRTGSFNNTAALTCPEATGNTLDISATATNNMLYMLALTSSTYNYISLLAPDGDRGHAVVTRTQALSGTFEVPIKNSSLYNSLKSESGVLTVKQISNNAYVAPTNIQFVITSGIS